MALSPGAVLGPYEIIAPIGAGGMGDVYRARDLRLRRDVAIKVLQASSADPAAAERLQREARTASALNHPHICAIYDIGETDGRPFLVMELLEGRTLRKHLAEGAVDAAGALAIAIQVADALDAAHAKGIIHRDIKPSNIVIGSNGHVTVLDFGLAKQVVAPETDETRATEALTQRGLALGTPQYMAPEVWQGRAADVRSDVWSLGVVLYEMLAGRVPFERPAPVETAAAILHDPLPALPARIPASLREIIERCLAKSPDARYQHVGELRRGLQALHEPVAGVSPPVRGRWGWVAAAAALVLVLTVALLVPFGRAEPETALTVTGAPASKNAEANDAFTLAMQFQRVQNDLARGQQQLERALILDPRFAEARRYHAFNYVIQILNGFSNDTGLLYKAEEELRQAERDDPTLASLPSAFASVYLLQGRKDMIPAAALDRASVQASVSRDAMLWRAIIAWLAGENAVVKELVGQSLEREPLFGAARMFLGETLRTEGDVAGAVRELRRVLEQAPNNVTAICWLVSAYLDADRPADARTLLEEKRGLFARNYLWRTSLALLQAREGRRTEALEALDAETLKFARGTFMTTLTVAEIYATLGERSQAVEWFETAVRNGDERVEWVRRNPRLASIRDDPRVQQILQSISVRRLRQP